MFEILKGENRLYILDNQKEIGEITYYEEGNNLVVDHTYVNPDYRGQNLARALVDEVVKFARSEGKKIIPVCSYVFKVFERTADFQDIWEKDNDKDVACKIR